MTSDFPVWRRQETRPLVKAYNSFAAVLLSAAFVLTFFFILSDTPLAVALAPVLGVAAFLSYIYLTEVRPELKRSSQSRVDRGSGLAEGVAAAQPDGDQNSSVPSTPPTRADAHSKVVGVLFLGMWLAWLLSFIAFLDANTVMWGAWASTIAVKRVIASSEPLLVVSGTLLGGAIAVTAYAEWRKPDFPLYSFEGLWHSSLNFLWFERFWWYSLTAESILFVGALYGQVSGCLAPCSPPGWGDVTLLSALILPLGIAAVDLVTCCVLLLRSRSRRERVPATFFAATMVWLVLAGLALYAFWAVISNPLP